MIDLANIFISSRQAFKAYQSIGRGGVRPGLLLAYLEKVLQQWQSRRASGGLVLQMAGGGQVGGSTPPGGGRTPPAPPPSVPPSGTPRKPRPMNTLKDPQEMLDEALKRQGAKAGDPYPAGYKEKWSENGYDYEVRIHQPPPNAPAGSNSASGPTYRIRRRAQGLDANGQGKGFEYLDDKGNWHKESDLRLGNPPGAQNDTHIPLPNGTIK